MNNSQDPFFKLFDEESTSLSQHLWNVDAPDFKKYPCLPSVKLKKVEDEDGFTQTLLKRKSADRFTKNPVCIDDVSYILRVSAGLSPNKSNRRVCPSGGAKYPVELYAAALAVDGLDTALYHYDAEGHALSFLKKTETDGLERHFEQDRMQTFPFCGAPVVFFMTLSKNRSIGQYGTLAYKLGFLEAGHIGQNIYLSAQKRGLGARASGGGGQGVNSFLEVDGINEHLLYIVAVGKESHGESDDNRSTE